MKQLIRVVVVPAFCLLAGQSCNLETAPAGPATSHRSTTADSPDGLISPPPARASQTDGGGAGGAGGLAGTSATRTGTAGIADDGGGGGSGSDSSAGAGGTKDEPSAGTNADAGGNAAGNASGAGGMSAADAGSGGEIAAAGKGAAGASQGGSTADGGRGGTRVPEAGRGGARGQAGEGGSGDDDDVATFDQLIDQLSDALTPDQRDEIVRALATNSVTPDQLNELLDSVTKAGACDSGHDTCQQMCRLVLSKCPTCMINVMTAAAEQAKCSAL